MSNITPLKAIRLRCLDCSCFSWAEVKRCDIPDCVLYPLRFGKGRGRYLRIIRQYCLWCCLGQPKEVKLCPADTCPLWQYRHGRKIKSERKQPPAINDFSKDSPDTISTSDMTHDLVLSLVED